MTEFLVPPLLDDGGVFWLALDLFLSEAIDSRDSDLDSGDGDRVILERDLERDRDRDRDRDAERARSLDLLRGAGERVIGE